MSCVVCFLCLPDMMRLSKEVNERESEREESVRNANEMTEGKKVRREKKRNTFSYSPYSTAFFFEFHRGQMKKN